MTTDALRHYQEYLKDKNKKNDMPKNPEYPKYKNGDVPFSPGAGRWNKVIRVVFGALRHGRSPFILSGLDYIIDKNDERYFGLLIDAYSLSLLASILRYYPAAFNVNSQYKPLDDIPAPFGARSDQQRLEALIPEARYNQSDNQGQMSPFFSLFVPKDRDDIITIYPYFWASVVINDFRGFVNFMIEKKQIQRCFDIKRAFEDFCSDLFIDEQHLMRYLYEPTNLPGVRFLSSWNPIENTTSARYNEYSRCYLDILHPVIIQSKKPSLSACIGLLNSMNPTNTKFDMFSTTLKDDSDNVHLKLKFDCNSYFETVKKLCFGNRTNDPIVEEIIDDINEKAREKKKRKEPSESIAPIKKSSTTTDINPNVPIKIDIKEKSNQSAPSEPIVIDDDDEDKKNKKKEKEERKKARAEKKLMKGMGSGVELNKEEDKHTRVVRRILKRRVSNGKLGFGDDTVYSPNMLAKEIKEGFGFVDREGLLNLKKPKDADLYRFAFLLNWLPPSQEEFENLSKKQKKEFTDIIDALRVDEFIDLNDKRYRVEIMEKKQKDFTQTETKEFQKQELKFNPKKINYVSQKSSSVPDIITEAENWADFYKNGGFDDIGEMWPFESLALKRWRKTQLILLKPMNQTKPPSVKEKPSNQGTVIETEDDIIDDYIETKVINENFKETPNESTLGRTMTVEMSSITKHEDIVKSAFKNDTKSVTFINEKINDEMIQKLNSMTDVNTCIFIRCFPQKSMSRIALKNSSINVIVFYDMVISRLDFLNFDSPRFISNVRFIFSDCHFERLNGTPVDLSPVTQLCLINTDPNEMISVESLISPISNLKFLFVHGNYNVQRLMTQSIVRLWISNMQLNLIYKAVTTLANSRSGLAELKIDFSGISSRALRELDLSRFNTLLKLELISLPSGFISTEPKFQQKVEYVLIKGKTSDTKTQSYLKNNSKRIDILDGK